MGDGEGKRDLLFHEWAALKKILKFQPLDDVRDYFGVKVNVSRMSPKLLRT